MKTSVSGTPTQMIAVGLVCLALAGAAALQYNKSRIASPKRRVARFLTGSLLLLGVALPVVGISRLLN